MLLSLTALPYSIAYLLLEDKMVINDSYSYRPDNIVRESLSEGLSTEMFCNEVSNISPLSLEPLSDYYIPSALFKKHFLSIR